MSIRTAHHWALSLAPQAGFIHAATSRLSHLLKAPLVNLNRRFAGLAPREARVAGQGLHYLEGGRGEPVLLLHGCRAEQAHWVDLARQLRPHHRVIVPDLGGFGAGEGFEAPRGGRAGPAERLRAFMDAIGVQRAHVAGSAMGGALGALLASEYPGRVASLAFFGAPQGLRSPEPTDTERLIDAGQAPLLVLWGRRDRVFHASGARALRWRRPDADIQVLERLGHSPLMEAPLTVAQRYRPFLERHRWMSRCA